MESLAQSVKHLQVPAAEETAAADTGSTTAASASSELLSQIKVVSCDIMIATCVEQEMLGRITWQFQTTQLSVVEIRGSNTQVDGGRN